MAQQERNQELTRKEQLLLSNPMELASVVRKQTLIVQNGLYLAGEKDDENQPLKVYAAFSRFVFAIINEEKKSVTANIRVDAIPEIRSASEYAYRMHMDSKYQPKAITGSVNTEVDTSSLAFTRCFSSGKMKGKTPVRIILEADDKEKAITMLNEQYKWLRDNARKNKRYAEGNQEQMDAIEQTAKLYRDGKLTAELLNSASGDSQVIQIYDSGFRPLTRREKRNGKSFVYQISINWTIGADYPIAVTISNYYATVEEKDDGRLNVMVKTKEQEQKNTMALSVSEWHYILYMIEANMRMFEERSRDACYKAAQNARRRSREMAGLETE